METHGELLENQVAKIATCIINMGGWITNLWWGGDPDLADSFSGLTKKEIYIVQKSWESVHADALANGTELFRRLYSTYPVTKEFFRAFRNLRVPEEKFINSPQFKAHVINLMSSLNLAIANLNQPEISAAIMNKLGESHAKRQIKVIHFMYFKEIMMQIFVEVLHINDRTQAAWEKVVDFLYKYLFETLNATESKQEESTGS